MLTYIQGYKIEYLPKEDPGSFQNKEEEHY